MLVRDVLRHKASGVVTVRPDAAVGKLIAALAEHNIGALVVTADGTRPVGIASERDIVRAIHDRGADLLEEPASAIMTTELVTISPDETIERVMVLMSEGRIRHLPVLESGRLVGIVSIGDVVRSRIDALETERASLLSYINAG